MHLELAEDVLDVIASGAVRPIVQSFDTSLGVPLLADVVVDPNARALLSLVTTPSHIGLPLLGPPGMAPDRLEVLRQSYLRVAKRAAIVAAGPIANFLLAIVIFSGIFMLFGMQTMSPRVDEVQPDSPAAAAGP